MIKKQKKNRTRNSWIEKTQGKFARTLESLEKATENRNETMQLNLQQQLMQQRQQYLQM